MSTAESSSSHSRGLRPAVILLGGAPGTGKTTVANELISKTAISHHLSTGFIRASIRHLLPEEDARVLARHAFDAWEELPPGNTTRSLLRGVARQADLLRPSIKACVQRAAREGIGLVVEGSHLLPGLFDPEEIGADLLCVLDVPDRELILQRALGPNHSLRELSSTQLQRLLQLQEEIVGQAEALGHPVVMNDDLDETVRRIHAMAESLTPSPPTVS